MSNKKIVATAIIFLLTVILITAFSGIYINTTDSVPIGLWIKHTETKLQKGQYVVICPIDNDAFRQAKINNYINNGYCNGNYEPLIKPIVALPGDIVNVSKTGISVNGKLIKNSEIATKDNIGRSLPTLNKAYFKVKDGEVWVVSSYNKASFDSRYFGALPISNVKSIVTPLWVR